MQHRRRGVPAPLAGPFLGLTLLLAPGTGAVAAEPEPSASSEYAAAVQTLADRGVHCIECYLLWDPNSQVLAAQLAEASRLEPVAGPAWLDIELTSVDGRTVRLADELGHPIVIELMATWCASCVDQQDALQAARADLPADTVLVSLDVDPASDAGALGRYASDHGWDWTFAPSPRDMSRQLFDAFGDLVLNPAGSPMVVIDRSGAARLAPFGHKDAAAIVAIVAEGG